MKAWFVIFVSVFVAELGDKTQLATVLFAADPKINRVGVFAASAAALVVSSLLAVLLGSQISRFVSAATLNTVAGLGFVIIGVWMLVGRG